jgi:hypothetical protein
MHDFKMSETTEPTNTNHITNSGTAVGGVLSIQERIRAMNDTLDNVEQRHKKQAQPTKLSTASESANNHTEGAQNDTIDSDRMISTPPVVKRSSVIDIWRMRENQNAVPATNAMNTIEKEIPSSSKGTVSKAIASSILQPNIGCHNNGVTNATSGRSPTRIKDTSNDYHWNTQVSATEQEEKKEDCDDTDISPVRKGAPIQAVAAASLTPPTLPASNRKNPVKPPATWKPLQQKDISQQEKLTLKNYSYPYVDLSIVQSTSSLSTSSGTKPLVSKMSSIPSLNNESYNSKVAMIREKLTQNSTTTTATSNSLPSTTVGSTVTYEITPQPPPQPSYEDKLISAFVQQSPNGPSSPKYQSVVDVWKNRTVTPTMDGNAISVSKNDSCNNKVAIIRENWIQSSIVATAASGSLTSSTAMGSTDNDETAPHQQQESSYEEKLVSALSPTGTSSPKRQSVVDIWKNRPASTTMDGNSIGINRDNFTASGSADFSRNSNVKHQGNSRNPDCQAKVMEGAEREDIAVSTGSSAAVVPSPMRNNISIADRWARRLAHPNSSTTTSGRAGQDTNKEVENAFAVILSDTFSTDRPSISKSNESDPGCDAVPPVSNRKGKVTDRYKVAAVTASASVGHPSVSPVISSLVKEHAARTPVLPYKKKGATLPETRIINDTTPIESVETQSTHISSEAIGTYVSSTVVNVMDKQIEKRHHKVTDRWTVHNHNSGTGTMKGNDTSDIPVSYGKVTDRYKPKSKTSASEPGISRFDSATVAELLKIHGGNTPAGKVRGGFKQHTNDGQQRLKKNVPVTDKSHSTCLSAVSEVSSPKRYTAVTDRWTSRQPSTVTIEEMNVASSHEIEPSNHALEMDGTTQDSEMLQEDVEFGRTVDCSPAMTNKSNVADIWKKRHVQTKESDHMEKNRSNNSLYMAKHDKILDENVTKPIENDRSVDGTDENIYFKEEVNLPSSIKDSQTLSFKSGKASYTSIRSSLNQNNNVGQSMKDSLGCIDSVTESDSHTSLIPATVAEASVGTAFEPTNVSATTSKPPHQVHIHNESIEKLQTGYEESGTVNLMNLSAFDRWNDEASRNYPIQNMTHKVPLRVQSKVADHTSQQVTLSELSARPEYAAPSDIFLSSPLKSACDLKNCSEIDDCTSPDIGTMIVAKSTCDTVKSPYSEKTLLPNSNKAITLSTKKLASDRASNKKRLQQYRGKTKKTLSSKLEATQLGMAEDDSSKSESKLSYHASDIMNIHESLAHLPSTKANNFDLNGLMQLSGNETRQSLKMEKVDPETEALETIRSAASTSSSSPLASKAERMLQNRRRRNKGEDRTSQHIHPSVLSISPPDHLSQTIGDEEPVSYSRKGFKDIGHEESVSYNRDGSKDIEDVESVSYDRNGSKIMGDEKSENFKINGSKNIGDENQ